MTPASVIRAAGGVVVRVRPDGRPESLVIHRPRYDDWSLPKGKLDGGESYRQCARREVEEETGHIAKLREPIGTVAYETPARNMKRVRYWLMESIEGEFRPNAEVDAIRWLRARKARATLDYPRDRAVLDRGVDLLKRPESGRILLVRHALAGDRAQWKGKDRHRPLSKRGKEQTAALTDALASAPVTRLISSKSVRCHETLVPLSEVTGIDLEHDGALAEGVPVERLRRLIKSLTGEVAALSTHGDIIEAYVSLLAKKGVRLDGPMKWKKASVWVIETRKGKPRSGHYVPAPG
ncbi:MAG: NUDIX domain-containing protein [Acidimicrobiia bacterium]